MTTPSLSINNIISINVMNAPVGLGSFNVNNLALFTSDSFVSNTAGDQYRVYVSAQEVGVDFGTSTETYQQAVAIFSQQPNILAGGGFLIICPAFATTSINAVTIAAAGTGYKVGDVLTVTQTGASFGQVTVATVYAGTVTSVTVTNVGIGYSAASGLATTGGSGTGCTITISSVQAETLTNAINRLASLIYFCGIISTNYGLNTTWAALATVVQAFADKLLFLPSNSQSDITGVFTTIQQATNYNTRCLYYGDSALASRLFAASYAARLMSVNFSGSNTAITMNLKQLTGVTPDAGMTQTIYNVCNTAGVDLYTSYGGVPGVASFGDNKFADESFNLIWFVSALKVAGFNALAQTSTKIPQTEPGMNLLKGAYAQVCEQALSNKYVAPGSWTATDTFGDQLAFLNNILTKGYYIYSQPVNQQSITDRQLRKAPLVQIAIKEAGAIHSSIVNVYINP